MTQMASLPMVIGQVEKMTADQVVLDIEDTDYRLYLVPVNEPSAPAGSKVSAVVRVGARRVDVVPSGGRYVEPVYGRPRRVQGRVGGGDAEQNLLYVQAGVGPLIVKLMPAQKAGDFRIGQLVSFDAEPGATFELMDRHA